MPPVGGGWLIAVDGRFGAVLLLIDRRLFGEFLGFARLNRFLNAGEMTA